MNQSENNRNHPNPLPLEEGELVDESQIEAYPSLDLTNQSIQQSNHSPSPQF
jgi:hypothetical protein